MWLVTLHRHRDGGDEFVGQTYVEDPAFIVTLIELLTHSEYSVTVDCAAGEGK